VKFLAAFQFLTSIPLPWRHEVRPEALGRSTGYFPIVGLIIGLILAGLNWLFLLFLPPALVNALLIAALALITGALHLDGLADTCDGLAGEKPVEERWQAMRDSRAGAYGIVGVVLLLLVKYVSLNSLATTLILPTLLLMPAVGRWAMVYAIFTHPYAHPSGTGTVFKQGTRWPQFTLATVTTFVIAAAMFVLFQFTGLAAMVLVWLLTMATASYCNSKFSGLTGDTYGAIGEIAETGVLIVVNLFHWLGLIQW